MNGVGWFGAVLAGTGLVVVALELALALPRARRLTKRLQELNLLLDDNLRLTQHELQLLERAGLETQALLRPYRRLQRWLTHPLTVALFASYRRRAGARRSATPVH